MFNKNQIIITKILLLLIYVGQSIPKGLHVRINLQTGLKEAKLIDTEDANNRRDYSNALLEIKEDEQKTEENIHSSDELKRVLENIKSDENLPPLSEEDINRVKLVKDKFKSYDELKKDLSDINLSVKSDIELLIELISKYKTVLTNSSLSANAKNDEIYIIFQDLEYLVHQIDNANDFINNKNFNELIYSNLNNSDSRIKSESLKILGTCVQNNPKVQIHALESGAVGRLTRLFALEKNEDVKMRALFSLSGLLRRFPLAQQHFIKNGGLHALEGVFEKPESLKIQLKVVTLMYDLLVEQKEAVEDKNNSQYKERTQQYLDINFKQQIINNGWCKIIGDMLVNNLLIEGIDHDSIERCLNLMSLVLDDCKISFFNTKLINVLYGLELTYGDLSDKELKDASSGTIYFTNLKDLTTKLLATLHLYKSEL